MESSGEGTGTRHNTSSNNNTEYVMNTLDIEKEKKRKKKENQENSSGSSSDTVKMHMLWDSIERIYLTSIPFDDILSIAVSSIQSIAARFQLQVGVFLNRTTAAWHPSHHLFAGEGIVMVAGGLRYVPAAYASIRLLRRANCTLPIEVWHKASESMTPAFKARLMNDYGELSFRNLDDIAPGVFGGFELKIAAIVFSRFERILYIDADNHVLRDPTYLLHCPEFLTTGLLVWPDLWHYEPGSLLDFAA
jgi:hypothetical protein